MSALPDERGIEALERRKGDAPGLCSAVGVVRRRERFDVCGVP